MEKLMDGVLAIVYAILLAYGGKYTLEQAVDYTRRMAFEKVAHGLGQLEPATRKMTGGKLDF